MSVSVKIPPKYYRNWIYYTLGGIAMWTVASYIRNNVDQLLDFWADLKIAGHSFYENQIKVLLSLA